MEGREEGTLKEGRKEGTVKEGRKEHSRREERKEGRLKEGRKYLLNRGYQVALTLELDCKGRGGRKLPLYPSFLLYFLPCSLLSSLPIFRYALPSVIPFLPSLFPSFLPSFLPIFRYTFPSVIPFLPLYPDFLYKKEETEEKKQQKNIYLIYNAYLHVYIYTYYNTHVYI